MAALNWLAAPEADKSLWQKAQTGTGASLRSEPGSKFLPSRIPFSIKRLRFTPASDFKTFNPHRRGPRMDASEAGGRVPIPFNAASG